MNYKLVDNRIEFTDEKLTENSTNMISVISTYKFTKYMEQMPDGISILRSNETRYTKLDVKNKYLQGVIYMPSKKDIFNHTRFGYLIFNRNILFIDSSDTKYYRTAQTFFNRYAYNMEVLLSFFEYAY